MAPSAKFEPAIGFLCPLYVELQAIIAIFDEYTGERSTRDDSELQAIYHYGRIDSRKAVVVSFAENEKGPDTAALYTERLLREHESLKRETSSCFLVGVAGGIWSNRQDIRLGDVVIATQVVDWRSGKIYPGDEFESTEHVHDASHEVRTRVPEFCGDVTQLGTRISQLVQSMKPRNSSDPDRWKRPGIGYDVLFKADVIHDKDSDDCDACINHIEHRHPRSLDLPIVHRGLIATGNVVLKDAATRRKLQDKKILAVEMEASGVWKARPHPKFTVIRGICDYADSHKNAHWQPYAAASAAACARLWIERYPPESRPQRHRSRSRSLSQDLKHDIGHSHDSRSEPRTEFVARSIPRNENDGGDGWTVLVSAEAVKIRLEMRNTPIEDNSATQEWASLTIVFEVENRQRKCVASRRFRLVGSGNSGETLRTVWLPHSDIRVQQSQSTLRLAFSNCNQRMNQMSGRFATRNGRPAYYTSYNPGNPNTTMVLQFSDTTTASNVSRLLLSSDERLLPPEHNEKQALEQHIVLHSSFSPNPNGRSMIHVWASNQNGVMLHTGGFTDKADFEICTREESDEAFRVFIGYMDQFIYEPMNSDVYHTAEPPQEVAENLAGEPRLTKFGGGMSSLSALGFVVGNQELCSFLSATVGQIGSWQMRAFTLDLDVSLIKNNTLFKLFQRNAELGLPQVSVWTGENESRVIVRTEGRDDQNCALRWIVCQLPSHHPAEELDGDHPSLQLRDDAEARLEHVTIHEGDCLSLDTLLPQWTTAEGPARKKTNTRLNRESIRLNFTDCSARASFKAAMDLTGISVS